MGALEFGPKTAVEPFDNGIVSWLAGAGVVGPERQGGGMRLTRYARMAPSTGRAVVMSAQSEKVSVAT